MDKRQIVAAGIGIFLIGSIAVASAYALSGPSCEEQKRNYREHLAELEKSDNGLSVRKPRIMFVSRECDG